MRPAIEKITPEDLDIAALGREIEVSGIPVIPFAKAVEARLPEKLRGDFHFATTTQDIVDTALALQMAEAFDLIAGDLDAILAGLMRLAAKHRRTPCAGRTLGQHAAPVTFGYVAALWLAGIAEVAAALPRIREQVLVVSLSGPVGTLAGLGDKGPKVTAAMAKALGLGVPPVGLSRAPLPDGRSRRLARDADRDAGEDRGRRVPPVDDRDRRGVGAACRRAAAAPPRCRTSGTRYRRSSSLPPTPPRRATW